MSTHTEEVTEKQIWRQMQDAVRYAGDNAVEMDASLVATVREPDCCKIRFAASRMRANNFPSRRAVDFYRRVTTDCDLGLCWLPKWHLLLLLLKTEEMGAVIHWSDPVSHFLWSYAALYIAK